MRSKYKVFKCRMFCILINETLQSQENCCDISRITNSSLCFNRRKTHLWVVAYWRTVYYSIFLSYRIMTRIMVEHIYQVLFSFYRVQLTQDLSTIANTAGNIKILCTVHRAKILQCEPKFTFKPDVSLVITFSVRRKGRYDGGHNNCFDALH